MNVFADDLDVFGVLVGAFLALVGVGTLVGMPWEYSGGGFVAAFQILGGVSVVALGAGLVWLVHTQ